MSRIGCRIPILLALFATEASAQLAATPRALDFGERGHMEKPTLVLIIENVGKKPIRVTEIKPSCGCIEVRGAALAAAIPPGGAQTLTVTMGSGRAMGVLDKYIAIGTDAGGQVLKVPARMSIHDGFSMEPWELRYDGVVGGPPVTRSVELRRKGRDASKPFHLTVERVVSPRFPGAAGARGHFEARVVEAQGSKKIEATLLPTHPEGPIQGNVEARLDGKSLIIPVAGEMFRWIKIAPREFNFSRVSRDDRSSFSKESILSSTDGRAFRIIEMKPSFHRPLAPGITIDFEASSGGMPATEHTLRAKISTGEGPLPREGFSGKLVVKTDHPEKPELSSSFFGVFVEPRK